MNGFMGHQVLFDSELTDSQFLSLKVLIHQKFGISLSESKRLLLTNRLRKMVTGLGLTSFEELCQKIRQNASAELLSELVNHVSTNHTYFFREPAHFEFLMRVAMPEWIGKLLQKNDLDLRFWSAGCSSGEEAWCIAMAQNEYLKQVPNQFRAGVLATDLSSKVLELASNAVYPKESIRDLPAKWKDTYLEMLNSGEFRVREFLRREVVFRRFNLMNSQFPFKKAFHVIFCRNVMIYFDAETKRELVKKFLDNLEVGGYLIIGHSESLDRQDCLQYVCPSVYKKVGA